MTATTPLSGTVVTTYTYDAAGRLTDRAVSDGRTYSYTWSAQGRMLAEWTQGYPVRTFTWDAAGRLADATVFTLTTRFTYDGDGARLGLNVVGHGATTYTLDYAAGRRVLAETTLTGTKWYLYPAASTGSSGCLGEYTTGDGWLYYLNDAAGYVRQGTDAQGRVQSAWLFDPDGTLLEGPEGPVSHLVCGGIYGWSTGLIFKDERYFDPLLGIWLALLPLIVVQSWMEKRRKCFGLSWISLIMLLVFVCSTLTACGNEEVLEQACLEVKRPSLNNIEIVSVGQVQVFPVPEGSGDWRVQFGSTPSSALDKPSDAGVVIEADFDAREEIDGTLEWVQDVVSRRTVERSDTGQRLALGDGKTRYLDTWDPYRAADTTVKASLQMWDIPGMPLPLLPPLKYATIDDGFRSFVMWRPIGLGCRIALGMISWEWPVEVENTKTEELVPHSADWVIISQSTPKVGTRGEIPTDLTPVLSPNIKDIEWQTVP